MGKTIDYALCQDCSVAVANDDYSGMSDEQAYRTRANLKRVGHLSYLSSGGEQEMFECDVCGNRRYSSPKNMFQGTRYAERVWKHTSNSSCSDDGLWMRRIDANTMAVVEFEYWENLDSSAIETHGRYNVQSGTVELDSKDLESALRSCGWELDAQGNVVGDRGGDTISDKDSSTHAYCLAQCLWMYGAKCVNHDESGNNRRNLIRAARNFAA